MPASDVGSYLNLGGLVVMWWSQSAVGRYLNLGGQVVIWRAQSAPSG